MTTTDHTATDCDQHAWCVAPHEPMCDCPLQQRTTAQARGCRYARDNDEEDHSVRPA